MLPVVARTIFRLQERLARRRTFAVLEELEASQFWPREELDAVRLDRARRLVAGAYQLTIYWREVMSRAGIRPEDIRRLDDLRRFPLLDRATIRARRADMAVGIERRGMRLVGAGGPGDGRIQFYTDAAREEAVAAARIRGHQWAGVAVGEREAHFWPWSADLTRRERLVATMVNHLPTDAAELSGETAAAIVARWEHWRPRCLVGYPPCFVLLVQMANRAGVDLRALGGRGLAAICTSGEVLAAEERKTIGEAFAAPVYGSYALREGGLIGHECEHLTMHTTDEQLILETIDPKTLQPTEGAGELVLTNLDSTVMPLIRYRTGQVVRLGGGHCACGRSLGRVAVSGGRVVDFVVTRDGKWMAGEAFWHVCRQVGVAGIAKLQVRQERKGEIRLLLATDGQFPPDGRELIARAVRARLDSGDRVRVDLVDDIPADGSGEYCPVVSKVCQRIRKEAALSGPAGKEAEASPNSARRKDSDD